MFNGIIFSTGIVKSIKKQKKSFLIGIDSNLKVVALTATATPKVQDDIIKNLSMVDEVIDFEDDENGSASQALVKIKNSHPDTEIIFCNGGDRTKDNIPEMQIENVTFEFGVGGKSKKNSSSWILKNFKNED